MLGIELLMGPKGATITYDSSSMSGCREIAKFLVKKLDKKHPTSGAPGPSGPLFNIFTPGVCCGCVVKWRGPSPPTFGGALIISEGGCKIDLSLQPTQNYALQTHTRFRCKPDVRGGAQGGKAVGRLPPAISRREMLLGGLGGIFTRYPPGVGPSLRRPYIYEG